MNNQTNFLIKAGPLLLALFIDGMGLGIVVPILNGLIFDPNSEFISSTTVSPIMHNVIYGLIIGIFMLCWFFGAAVLGDLSDQIGRKKALIICLVGAFLSYVLSAYSVHFKSLTLMIIGRIVAGFTSGSQPIAQAAVIDLSGPKEKARNIGYILLALSLGFIFGPLLGGLLADSNIVSWFNFATPFYFAAIISFINIIILWISFKETFVSKTTTFKINPYHAVDIFISAFKHPTVRGLSVLFFIFIFGWSSFYSFISMYLLKVYHFTPTQISIYMALMGVGFGVANGWLVNYAARFFTLVDIFFYSSLATGVLALLAGLIPSILFNWIIVAPIGCLVAGAYTSILTLFSDQVDEKSQGWVMGITGSIMAFVWAVNGVVLGIVAAFHDAWPLYISGLSLLLSVVATRFLYTKREF